MALLQSVVPVINTSTLLRYYYDITFTTVDAVAVVVVAAAGCRCGLHVYHR